MLTSSFCHMRGVGPAAERKLWSLGILGWGDLERDRRALFSKGKTALLERELGESRKNLESGNMAWFLKRLPVAQRVRIYPHVENRIAYLDIETTGLGRNDIITSIAIYGRGMGRCYIRGGNLRNFIGDVSGYPILVTYNGERFDLPRLRRAFGEPIDAVHLDLLPVLRAWGYWGGLKKCVERMGLKNPLSQKLDGSDAVTLWRQYRQGDKQALRLLAAYNLWDAVCLEQILVKLYNRSMDGFPVKRPIKPGRTPDVMEVVSSI